MTYEAQNFRKSKFATELSQDELDFLTVEEVARQLRVSPKTVRAWLVHGRMHGFKLTPKVWRIRREDFQAFVTAAERQADESMER